MIRRYCGWSGTLVIRLALILVLGAAAGTAPTTQQAFVPIADHRLHNAHVLNDKLISGAQPEGEAGFAALRALGVRTIISVDGAKPDVAMAKRFGMRYVHLPIGYDDVAVEEGMTIAKAIDELPGRIYLHCHHGKHRSAAAVAVACVYNQMLTPDRAEAVLQTFGTGVNYNGLWKSVRAARPRAASELRQLDVEFVETAAVGDLAARMVNLDQHWEHVKQIREAGWRSPADHPDLDPPHEVLQVQEHLHESGRLESAAAHPADFLTRLRAAESASAALRTALSAQPVDPNAAEAAFQAIAQSCTSCHEAYRD